MPKILAISKIVTAWIVASAMVALVVIEIIKL